MKHVVIKNLSEALRLIKEMNIVSDEQTSYRDAAREAIATVLRDEMVSAVGNHLAWIAEKGIQDRRNGSYPRHVLTELGDVILSIPRTRYFVPKTVIGAYARRSRDVNDLILACFLLGLSTRKVGKALSLMLHETVSPETVSRVAKTLDHAVEAFHRRKLSNRYRALILDGILLRRKSGMGALTRPVLVALGLRPDGKKEVIDFRCVVAESAAAWESFLTDLIRRGLTGENLEVICADGGKGLIATLPLAYPHVPLQRCWAHKMRNIMNTIRKQDQKKAKSGLVAIYTAETFGQARHMARLWMKRWEGIYPKAVACLRNDLDDLLTCFAFDDPAFRKAIRTTNAIERKFREVRRRTRPMGVMADKSSMERILYAIFMYENISQGVYPVFSLTQNN